MKSRSDVSVVIPAYNRARWIGRAVESVLRQDPPPLEVILVDDGSTDSTPQICRALECDTVRYVRQENQGPSVARNHGVSLARGEFVAFLDSDDLALPGRLAVQREAIIRFPGVGWSFCDHVGLDAEDRWLPAEDGTSWGFLAIKRAGVAPESLFGSLSELRREVLSVDGRDHVVFVGDYFRALFYGNFISPSGFMCRVEAFCRTGGFRTDWRLAEDTEFFHRMAATIPGSGILTPLFGWRRHVQGGLVSRENIVTLIRNGIASMDSALELRGQPSPEVLELHRRTLEGDYRALAYTLLSELDGPGARAVVRETHARLPRTRLDIRFHLLHLAAFLPRPLLRLARWLKSTLPGGGRPDPLT